METNNFWSMGLSTGLGLLAGGAFGSSAQKFVTGGQTNPPSVTAQPSPVAVNVPVPGASAYTPGTGNAVVEHFRANWGKYAAGVGIVLALSVGMRLLRRK